MTDATGWGAVYANEKPDKVGNPFEVVPLVCAAMIADEETGETSIVGMVPEGLEFIPCVSPTFLGYLAPNQSVEDFLPILTEWRGDQTPERQREKAEALAEIRAAAKAKGN